ncbi:MAG: response regulator [Pseudohongiellaceae bacterium]
MNNIAALIVDDSEEDRYLLSRQLSETKLVSEVIEKENGQQALLFFREHEKNRMLYPDAFPPLLVFLDINMPLINGYEFLKEFEPLRKEIQAESSVVLMFTSSEKNEEEAQAMAYDFVKDYLVKGKFSSQQLREKIQKLL